MTSPGYHITPEDYQELCELQTRLQTLLERIAAPPVPPTEPVEEPTPAPAPAHVPEPVSTPPEEKDEPPSKKRPRDLVITGDVRDTDITKQDMEIYDRALRAGQNLFLCRELDERKRLYIMSHYPRLSAWYAKA